MCLREGMSQMDRSVTNGSGIISAYDSTALVSVMVSLGQNIKKGTPMTGIPFYIYLARL